MSAAGELILDHVERHARLRPAAIAVESARTRATARADLGRAGAASRPGRDGAAGARGCAGRAGRLPAAEPARIRHDRARDAAHRRRLRAADADLPRARAVVHAPRERAPGCCSCPSCSAATTTPRWRRGCGRAGGARARRGRSTSHVPAGDGCAAATPPTGPRPGDQIAQLLFTSGTSGEPKGVLHRHDTLMRSRGDHQIATSGSAADDVIYIPSPLAHQTGFLYGMWIALRLGVPQVLQEVWDAEVGLRRDAADRRDVRAGGDAVPGRPDPRWLEERGETPGPAADVRRHRRRDPARAGAAVPRGARRRGRRRLGHDRELPGDWRSPPAIRPNAPGAPTGARSTGSRLRIVDDDGRAAAPPASRATSRC